MPSNSNVTAHLAELHAKIDWLTANLDTFQKFNVYVSHGSLFLDNTSPENIASFLRETSGTWRKEYGNNTVEFVHETGYSLYVSRERVCRKVPTGRKVTVRVPEYREVEEDEYTWECEPILAHIPNREDN